MKNKFKQIIKYLLDKIQEPSTIRGVILLSSVMGAKISRDMEMAILEVGLILAGILAIIMPDSWKNKNTTMRRIGGAYRGSSTRRSSPAATDEYDIKG